MKTELVQVKSGYTGQAGEPTRDEIREAGYTVQDSATLDKYYAVDEFEVELPTTISELVTAVGGGQESEEIVVGWAISKYKTSKIYDSARKEIDAKLRKEIPANCKKVLEALTTLDLVSEESLTFEEKSDIDYLKGLI